MPDRQAAKPGNIFDECKEVSEDNVQRWCKFADSTAIAIWFKFDLVAFFHVARGLKKVSEDLFF